MRTFPFGTEREPRVEEGSARPKVLRLHVRDDTRERELAARTFDTGRDQCRRETRAPSLGRDTDSDHDLIVGRFEANLTERRRSGQRRHIDATTEIGEPRREPSLVFAPRDRFGSKRRGAGLAIVRPLPEKLRMLRSGGFEPQRGRARRNDEPAGASAVDQLMAAARHLHPRRPVGGEHLGFRRRRLRRDGVDRTQRAGRTRRRETGSKTGLVRGDDHQQAPGSRRHSSRLVDPPVETASRLPRISAVLLVIDPQLAPFIAPEPGDPPVVGLDELEPGPGRPSASAYVRPADDPDALAILQYTSGSTSDPKGVMLPHRCVTANLDGIVAAAGLTTDDVGVSWLPLYHDMGLIGLLTTPMTIGMDLALAAPQDFLAAPARWMEWMDAFGGTATAGPNFSYVLAGRALRRLQGLDLRRWSLALNGAEPVDPASVEGVRPRRGAYGSQRRVRSSRRSAWPRRPSA